VEDAHRDEIALPEHRETGWLWRQRGETTVFKSGLDIDWVEEKNRTRTAKVA